MTQLRPSNLSVLSPFVAALIFSTFDISVSAQKAENVTFKFKASPPSKTQ
jgi:hypothetical protein